VTLTLGTLEAELITAGVPAPIAHDLFDAFTELKRRLAINDLRPNVVEGGRFSEAAFRVLQWLTTDNYVPIGTTLPKVPTRMGSFASSGHASDSVRLHIPRSLNVIYDIRNKRDAAHLADGINPNVQDSSLVVAIASWVLAEFVRLLCSSDPNDAHRVIDALVAREIPLIQEIDGFPRILKTLTAIAAILALLYWSPDGPVSVPILKGWLPKAAHSNLRRTLSGLETKHHVHVDLQNVVHITRLGERFVVESRLLETA
jgi:hypothetical protein